MRSELALMTNLVLVLLSCAPRDAAPRRPCHSDRDCGHETCTLIQEERPEQAAHSDAHDIATAALSCTQASSYLGVPGDDCEDASACRHGLCSLGGGCVSPCQDDNQCESGEVCNAIFVHQSTGTASTWACLSAVAPHAQSRLKTTTTAVEVMAGTQTIQLPGSTSPTLYVIEHPSDGAWPFSIRCRPPLCPTQLSDTSGNILFAANVSSPVNSTPVSGSPYTFPLTVYPGNSPQPAYDADGYALTLDVEQPGTLRISTVHAAAPPGSRLDLNIYYAGTLLRAPSDGTVDHALIELEDIYRQVDIQLGTVRHLDIPQDMQRRGDTFENADNPRNGFSPLKKSYGVWPELPALLRLSAGSPNSGINLFLVSDIEGMGGGDIQALAGGTPGPLGMQGTGASGIVIAADMMQGKGAQLGKTMAHEIAHCLGLFHIYESDGTSLDPLEDTPKCSMAANTDSCNAAASLNLMYWAKEGGTQLTVNQQTILKRAPILY